MPKDLSRERYGSAWDNRIRPQAIASTHDHCILCFCSADEVHHAYYVTAFGAPVKDNEVPGWTVFPLCPACHGRAHRKRHWIRFRDPNRHLSHNKRWFVWYLRFRFVLAVALVNIRLTLRQLLLFSILIGVIILALVSVWSDKEISPVSPNRAIKWVERPIDPTRTFRP